MKGIISACLVILTAVMLVAVMPTEAEAMVYEDTLRLHILAPSDDKEDQELKLAIRDRVLGKYGEELSRCQEINEVRETASSLLCEIECDVIEWIKELGYSYGAEVTLTEEWYDTREYDGFTLPRGIYSSLRIIIGEGQGKNWWCIMYPPLCLDASTEPMGVDDALLGYTSEEIRLVSGGRYKVKFKLLEIFSDAFS